jgi:SPOR domain
MMEGGRRRTAADRGGRKAGLRRSVLRTAGVMAALVSASVRFCPSLSAQSNPRLLDAVRLAQAGRSDSAHGVVSRMLASTPASDSVYPEVVYTMGLVSGDLDEMQRYFQRVVVEYSTTRWADVSLYRLAQIAFVRKDWEVATRQLERIRSDYPGSALLPRAAFWAAQIYADHRNDAPAACRWAADGLAHAANDPEMQKSLGEFQAKRCGKVQADGGGRKRTEADAGVKADSSAKPDSSASAPVRPGPPPSAPYQVQVAAMATPEQAADVVEKLRQAGFEATVVTDKGLYKVRVGGYETAAAAAKGAQAIKAKLGGSPFVVRP